MVHDYSFKIQTFPSSRKIRTVEDSGNQLGFALKIRINTVINMVGEKDTKFYFYEVSGKKDEKPIDLVPHLAKIDWATTQFPITSPSGVVNEIMVESVQADYYYGRIFKSKSKKKYYGKDKGAKPDELKTDAEFVGEKDSGVVNFVFTPQDKKLIFLVEVGFQTAGMGFIKDFLTQIFAKERIELKYYPMLLSSGKREVKSILSKRLKSISIQFRKNADVPKDCKQVEDTLSKLISPEFYAIDIHASVRRVSDKLWDKIPLFGDVYRNIFGSDLEKAIEAGIDFPSFLTNFEVEVIDDAKKTRQEDILGRYERENIKMNKNKLEDSEIKIELCEALAAKINKEFDADG